MNRSLWQLIHVMRQNGANIDIVHQEPDKLHRGRTVIRISTEYKNREVVVSGDAKCSRKDIFCKAAGGTLAMKRALLHLREVIGRKHLKKLCKTPPSPPTDVPANTGVVVPIKRDGMMSMLAKGVGVQR